jgi:RNA polymerase sigma factor (sigma-70 family)
MSHDEPASPMDGRSDREAIANFMLAHEAALRRRIQHASRGAPGLDPDDLFSTTLRRVDGAVVRGSFRMRSAPEAWSFLTRVLQRAVERHRQRAARGAAAAARVALQREPWDEPPDHAERADLAAVLQELQRCRPQDAELVQLRLRGKRWREISQVTGVSEVALRQRWSALLMKLRDRVRSDGTLRAKAG